MSRRGGESDSGVADNPVHVQAPAIEVPVLDWNTKDVVDVRHTREGTPATDRGVPQVTLDDQIGNPGDSVLKRGERDARKSLEEVRSHERANAILA